MLKKWLVVFCIGVLGLAVAACAEEGTADGTLTIAGKTTPLTHAYARVQKGFFDPKKEDVLVILSDVAIPEEALADEFARFKMAGEGKLHAVEVVLDAEKQAVSGRLLHEAYKGYVSVAGIHEFQAKAFDAKIVEGRLFTEGPRDVQDRKVQYDATFRAPVRRAVPTATGAAAAQTAPGKVVLEFMKAARSGDKAAMQKLMSAQTGERLNGERANAMLERLKEMTPDPKTAKIEEVYVTGKTAKVVVVEPSKDGGSTSRYSLVLDGDQWKIN